MAEYNGWSNHPTWLVNLWLSNEQGTDREVRELVRDGEDHEAAHRLKEWVNEQVPDLPGMFSDLIRSSLDEVNWIEIAKAFREE